MTINEKIAAAIVAAAEQEAEQEAENERDYARARNAQWDAQRYGLREVMGALYDELGVVVDSAASGWFEFEDVRFEVAHSVARAAQLDWNGRLLSSSAAAFVLFSRGVWDEGGVAKPYEAGESDTAILAWIGERAAVEKALRAAEAEALATHERLTAMVAEMVARAEQHRWRWAAEYVLEYWRVTWHKGGGVFESAYAFAVPFDGDLLHTINGRAIFLTEAHLPVYERFEARSVEDLPHLLIRELVAATLPGVARVDGKLVTDDRLGAMEVTTSIWVPVLAICEFIDEDVFDADADDDADADADALVNAALGAFGDVRPITRAELGILLAAQDSAGWDDESDDAMTSADGEA